MNSIKHRKKVMFLACMMLSLVLPKDFTTNDAPVTTAAASFSCQVDDDYSYLPVFSSLDWHRTSFHFQPKNNWMNDPNGPIFYKGLYHLFYQYHPDAPIWGKTVWGHAVSKDLVNWSHLPIALENDQWYDAQGVWSGSITILSNDKLVILYTGYTNESVQVQNLAYPDDPSDPLLIKWVKYPGNPVLVSPPPGIDKNDFRDPTTAWKTPEGKWRMVIGSKINGNGILLVYETQDFNEFELLDEWLHVIPRSGMLECVDFYPVCGVKYLVKVSLDDIRKDYYSIGTYDAYKGDWTPDNPTMDIGSWLKLDHGVFYASKTFYDQNKHRRILWSWIKETDTNSSHSTRDWASIMGVPRTIEFDKRTQSNIIQWPVEEINELRMNLTIFNNIVVEAGSLIPLPLTDASQLDIVAEFELDKETVLLLNGANVEYNCAKNGGAAQRGELGPFGFAVLADEDLLELTSVYFYVVKGVDGNLKTYFCTDQSRTSIATNVDRSIYGDIVTVLEGEKLSMRILVDHSIVESFAQEGRTCITSRVYPTKTIYNNTRLFLFNNATAAKVAASVKVWNMKAAQFSFN